MLGDPHEVEEGIGKPGLKSRGGGSPENLAGVWLTELGLGRELAQPAFFNMAEPDFAIPAGLVDRAGRAPRNSAPPYKQMPVVSTLVQVRPSSVSPTRAIFLGVSGKPPASGSGPFFLSPCSSTRS